MHSKTPLVFRGMMDIQLCEYVPPLKAKMFWFQECKKSVTSGPPPQRQLEREREREIPSDKVAVPGKSTG